VIVFENKGVNFHDHLPHHWKSKRNWVIVIICPYHEVLETSVQHSQWPVCERKRNHIQCEETLNTHIHKRMSTGGYRFSVHCNIYTHKPPKKQQRLLLQSKHNYNKLLSWFFFLRSVAPYLGCHYIRRTNIFAFGTFLKGFSSSSSCRCHCFFFLLLN
jgi:hypothetical protein